MWVNYPMGHEGFQRRSENVPVWRSESGFPETCPAGETMVSNSVQVAVLIHN